MKHHNWKLPTPALPIYGNATATSAIKAEIQKLGDAFEAFKTANNARVEQIETNGVADASLTEKVEKANTAVTDLQAKIAEMQTATGTRLDEIEAAAQRPDLGGAGDSVDVTAQARQFYAQLSAEHGSRFEDESVNLEEYENYRRALTAYWRKGDSIGPEIKAALSVGTDPEGGVWVAPDMSGRIATLMRESSPMRTYADVQTIGTDALEGIDDLGEAGSGWVGETEARVETTTPKVGVWRIPAHELYAEPKSTQKLLDDSSYNVESWLERKVADKFMREENAAFVKGTGVAQPRGFLTYDAGLPTDADWQKIEQTNSGVAGAFAATSPGDALVELIYNVKANYRMGSVFAMSRSTLGEVRKLKDGDGNYLWQPNFQMTEGNMLLGFPVAEFDDMPDIAANSLSIAFGNFGLAYQIVDRTGIRVLRDPFTQKGFVKFYSTKRTGGGVVNFEAVKILKFAA